MNDPATFKDLEFVFARVIGIALYLAGIVVFIMLVIGGFKYLTSGGDPKAVEGAKKTITYAIGGLVVLILAFVVLLVIREITGVDVTKFTIPTN